MNTKQIMRRRETRKRARTFYYIIAFTEISTKKKKKLNYDLN